MKLTPKQRTILHLVLRYGGYAVVLWPIVKGILLQLLAGGVVNWVEVGQHVLIALGGSQVLRRAGDMTEAEAEARAQEIASTLPPIGPGPDAGP